MTPESCLKHTTKMDEHALAAHRGTWRARLQDWLERHPGAADDVQRLDAHGLLPLLDWCAPELPAPTRAAAHKARRELLAREGLHRQCLEALDQALQPTGVQALLMKGEALATTLFAAPALRPRHDIDLWVQPGAVAAVETALAALGGSPAPSASGRWIQPERLWRMPSGRARTGIDLHWQAVSRPSLLPALDFVNFLDGSQPLPGLRHIRAPDAACALRLACVHRWAHHRRDGDRCIWRVDIALLWESLGADGHASAVQSAVATGVASLVLAGLDSVRDWIALPAPLRDRLAEAGAREDAAQLLRHPGWPDWRFDLRTTRGWQRWQVLGDYLLPDPRYIRARYPGARVRWLPWLYLRRLLRV